MSSMIVSWVNNKFSRTYLDDDCICVDGEINVENLPNTREEDVISEAMSYFNIYPSAKCINLSLNGENIKILPSYSPDDVLAIYHIKKDEHLKADAQIQKRIKAYFNKEHDETQMSHSNGNSLVKSPVYFLYTSTRSTNGYSTQIVDYPQDGKHNFNKIVSDIVANIFSNYSRQPYYELEIEDYKVACFYLMDCRRDEWHRNVATYLGVLVDKNDDSFDVEQFKSKIGEPKFSEDYTVFDLIKEKNIPIKFNSKLDINREEESSR